MKGVQLHPVDTWFFRGGEPFLAGESPQQDVGNLFPPYPPTIAGALRAALARANGWNGAGRWRRKHVAVLGDGPEDLGRVSFDGPFLLRGGQPLFQAPRHLLGVSDGARWRPAASLRPGEHPAMSDIGRRSRLPDITGYDGEVAELKPPDSQWFTADGLNSALRGELPADETVLSDADLWSSEVRIGLERDNEKRSAVEGMLYSVRHARPARGVSLGARVSGLPEDWTLPVGRMTPLGGESRLAELRSWNAELGLDPPLERIERSGEATLIALTPIDIERDVYVGESPIPNLGDARVVSACLDRPLRIGGWDSDERRPRPLPMRSVLPAGSALFCEIPKSERLAHTLEGGGLVKIGNRTEMGFGLAALGVWPG